MKESVQNSVFNRYLGEFTDDIIKRFPRDPNVLNLKLLKIFLNTSPSSSIPRTTFKKHITEDMACFIKGSNAVIFGDGYGIASITDGHESDVFSIIRTLWKRLDDEEKKIIWQYLQAFVQIIGM
jgi:hypothetical protein